MAKRRGGASDQGLPSREAILEFLRDHPGRAGKREIARAFGVKSADRIALKRLLRDMEDDGQIEGRRKRVQRAGHMAPVEELEITGRDRDGELIAAPTDWDEALHGAAPSVLILPDRSRKSRMPVPGVGDRVMARVREVVDETGATHHEGKVVRILDRRPRTVIGVFTPRPGGGGVVHSVDKKERRDLTVAPEDTGDARKDDLVAVEIRKSTRFGPPRAVVREVVGDMKSEKAVSQIALLTHGIPQPFADDVIAEAEAATPAAMAGREDLRSLPLVTIDPADAKDHDDAVHAAPDADPDNKGGFVVTVAIADVAWYVRPNGALDRSARERGNSVYFPDRVVPMLPEQLSADLCSLKENQDRPVLACEMAIAPDGRVRRHRFLRAMVRVAANIDYRQTQAAIDGQTDEQTGPLLDTVLKPLWDAYRAVAKARDARAPLELEIPERKLILDKTGHVARVLVPERLESHKLIEVFMILANVAAAETLEKKHTPLIYRVHDSPSPEKLAALADFLATIGLKLPKAGVLLPHHFNGILAKVEGTENERLVHEVVLRSQAQAEYTPENFGHFGLNLRRYAHFTSPIRRYADLIVHRALIRALDLGKDGLSDRTIADLDEISAHISATERRAMAAERETVDRLIADFLADRVGARFHGTVTGVTKSGLFVRLDDTGADGFIPASTLGADYFRFDEAGRRMVGERTGEAFTLGDPCEVKLVEAVPLAGALRFEIVSEGKYVSIRPGRKAGGRARSGGGARARKQGKR
ncbi:ribonuclease R [Microbaculum marinisediminis]|uniref:Ribonuclease R n=1 Tax=Microbaculum marinisediminis TaxID=2931392 RepID=A0AAW5QYP9_9HYPH|nr:ribonuclease R [Microbaculum sp. A6E488]MCT8973181.1 ribonuclease R [Microbaculum sp. A6E488]